jgi:hypothetical protein
MNPLNQPFAQIEAAFKELEQAYHSKAASESNRAQVLYKVRSMIERASKENKIDAEVAKNLLEIILPATCHGPENKP